MDNYIMFEGKKIPLTEEQVAMLKDKSGSPLKRQKIGERYYYIGGSGSVYSLEELDSGTDYNLFEAGNYCTNKELMHQRAMHETLDRLLWRFSMENGEMDNPWDNLHNHYIILMEKRVGIFSTTGTVAGKANGIYFPSRELAERAIDEIIKPFMGKHPDFVW